MKLFSATLTLFLASTLFSFGDDDRIITKKLSYEIEGDRYEGQVFYEDDDDRRPALLMVPNWMGPTEESAEKAIKIARMGYVVFMADVYGVSVRPSGADEAKEAAGYLRANRDLLRKRTAEALKALKDSERQYPIKRGQYAAIGFCFGGGAVLELARSGEDLPLFVSFHGNLDTPNPEDANNIQGELLVFHGAVDPAVPQEQVAAFMKEMKDAKADYTFIAFSNAVHSFTDPHANRSGYAEYQPRAAKQAFLIMDEMLDELFDD